MVAVLMYVKQQSCEIFVEMKFVRNVKDAAHRNIIPEIMSLMIVS
jgi:hypothetical protein